MNNFSPFLIFLMGPTASGKSKLAIELRSYLPIDLISVDSALIYRHMNIGTAKPNYLQLSKNPIQLIDFKDPTEVYSASEFRQDALQEIRKILNNGRIPLLVGGTMFYYHVLLYGISPLPKSDFNLRNKILVKSKYNSHYLHKYLSEVDLPASKNIHPNDMQRLLRALEVYLITGNRISDLQKIKKNKIPYNVLQFAKTPNKKILYQKIQRRFKNMLLQGLELEVKSLLYRGDININLPSMRCIGYRHMYFYLLNLINYNEMVNQSILSTQQLAKRQMTWIRRLSNVYYLYNDIDLSIQEILSIVKKKIEI